MRERQIQQRPRCLPVPVLLGFALAGGLSRPRQRPQPPLATRVVNELMREKYGWRDSFLKVLFGGRENAMAVRLQPSA